MEIEEGSCSEHFTDKKGWLWISLLFAQESTRSCVLCLLDQETYGMEDDCGWCILEKTGEGHVNI